MRQGEFIPSGQDDGDIRWKRVLTMATPSKAGPSILFFTVRYTERTKGMKAPPKFTATTIPAIPLSKELYVEFQR
jgi:hypothetical protein